MPGGLPVKIRKIAIGWKCILLIWPALPIGAGVLFPPILLGLIVFVNFNFHILNRQSGNISNLPFHHFRATYIFSSFTLPISTIRDCLYFHINLCIFYTPSLQKPYKKGEEQRRESFDVETAISIISLCDILCTELSYLKIMSQSEKLYASLSYFS
jgi:hypothetical protein